MPSTETHPEMERALPDTLAPSGAQDLEPLPLFDLRLTEEDLQAVADTLRSGWLSMGPMTQAFERAFAEQLGAKHAVAMSSCTAALHLAYLAVGVGPGDEVIVPSYTFAATASAVLYCGATPVFADIIGSHDLSIDPAEVERLITPRTKAVAAVHFAGYAAPVDRLAEICRERGVDLIEDAAHSPSATLHGRKLGTFGRASAFSLFSNKVLSVGEGGLLVTDDDEIAAYGPASADPRDDGHELGEAPGSRTVRRRRIGLQLPHRRAAQRARPVAARPPRGGHRSPAGAHAPLSRCAVDHTRRDRAVQRRGCRHVILLRAGDRAD